MWRFRVRLTLPVRPGPADRARWLSAVVMSRDAKLRDRTTGDVVWRRGPGNYPRNAVVRREVHCTGGPESAIKSGTTHEPETLPT